MNTIKNILRAGRKGLWRARKYTLWLTVIFISAFIVYAQLMHSTPLAVEDESLHSSPRFLYLVGREDQNKNGASISVLETQTDRVRFMLSVNNSDKSGAASHIDDKISPREESVLQEQHKNAVDALHRRISDQKVDSDNEKRNARSSFSNTRPNVEKLRRSSEQQHNRDKTYVGNAAAAWSGGSFRYNPYGEPIYNHDNRPNYIPAERVFHLDLKGAPPLPSVYKTLIPWLVKYGATSILLEYEDMFPWEGPLASIATKNHYTKEEIKEILDLCEANNLSVIPLVQTFGHLELALKLPKFSYLREVPEMPQALCPSHSDSLWLVRTLIDQVMSLHPKAKYIHIGCDEVFQIGECDKCRLKSRETLFLDHVASVAKYVRSKYTIIPIIWHDMLSHVSEGAMQEYRFGELVEPMIWVYAEDVYRFVQPTTFSKFAQVFPKAWAASAFKGAFGEQSAVPNVRRHLDNNQNWLDVMVSESPKFSGGFRGLVITGWQRHDHFAVLCELLPAALPSLAVNLITISNGFFNTTMYPKIYEALSCMQTPKYQTGLNLDSDPFLWDKFSWCFFPGSLVFKATARLDSVWRDVRGYIDRVTLKRGWITAYNRRHNFTSPMRVDEDLEELPSRLHSVTLLLKTAKEALSEWFDEWTVGEWIEERIWPLLQELEQLQKDAESMKLVKTWPSRPLPLIPQLEAYGIKEPSSQNLPKDDSHTLTTNQRSHSGDSMKRPSRTIHL